MQVLEAAEQYLRAGFSVIPTRDRPYSAEELEARAKRGEPVGDPDNWRQHPAIKYARYKSAPPTIEDARAWWGRARQDSWRDGTFSSESGIALVCGRVSGVIVFDCDIRHGGDPAELPPTGLRQQSGGGGVHAFYRWREGVKTARHPFLRGVEVKADRSLVQLAPSMHKSGNVYRWLELGEPAECPANVVRASSDEQRDQQDSWLTALLGQACPEGQRHEVVTRIAGYFAHRNIPEDIGVEIVKCWSDARSTLSPEDVEATVRGVYRTDSGAWETPSWETPCPSFPLDLLPTRLREFVEAIAENVQTCVDLPAVQALGMLGVALSGRRVTRVDDPRSGGESWREEAAIFTCNVLDPSVGKSPSLKPIAFAPIELELDRQSADWMARIEAAKSARRRAEQRLKTVEAQIARVSSTDSDATRMALMQEHQALVAAIDRPLPAKPKLHTIDATPESLEVLLTQYPSMSVVSDEGRVLFTCAGGGYSGAMRLGPYLHMYSGGTLATDRLSREAVSGRVRGGVVITVQRNVLLDAGKVSAFHGEGLFARFLWSVPGDIPVIEALANPLPVDQIAWWLGVLRSIWSLPQAVREQSGRLNDPEAFHLLDGTGPIVALRARMNALGRAGAEMDGQADWLGKMHGQGVRLAALLHVAEGRLEPGEIPLETVERAIDMIERYWIPHGLRAYELLAGTDIRDAKILHSRFKIEGRFTRREAERAFRGWGDDRLRRAIDVLERRGFARIVSGGQWLDGKRVRADGLVVVLNPKARNLE